MSSDEHIKINASKLISWIVQRYATQGFQREQAKIAQAHFNSKEYLKRVMAKSSSEAELTEALHVVLKKIEPEKKRGKSGRPKIGID